MKVEIGDKITALGYTFKIARVMYQDYYKAIGTLSSLTPMAVIIIGSLFMMAAMSSRKGSKK